MAADKPIDFDDEARKLWARLNLDPSTKVRGAREWNDLDAIWRDPKTGGTIYVGNQNAAGNLAQLQQHAIARVVNCTSGFSKIKNFHEGKLSYFEFDIARWQLHVDKKDGSVGRFVAPLFEFIDGALAKGESVLVHCLAGAHRAGTTGCACLMWYVCAFVCLF